MNSRELSIYEYDPIIESILNEWHLEEFDGKLKKISLELLLSAKQFDSEFTPNIERYKFNISKIIGTLRRSYDYYPSIENETWDELMSGVGNDNPCINPKLFLDLIEKFDDNEKKELMYKYEDHKFFFRKKVGDLLFNEFFNDNETYRVFPCLIKGDVEKIASTYCANEWMQSSTLEYVLIDSLVFDETLDYAKFTLGLKSKNLLNNYFFDFMKSNLNIAFELIDLFIIGSFLSWFFEGLTTNFWVFFSSITIIKFLKPNRLKKIKLEETQLALYMINISNRTKDSRFNGNHVRELIYDLEKKGAFYSPWVFHLLDKRIRRTV